MYNNGQFFSCGLSYIGKVEPVTAVYLSFVCDNVSIHNKYVCLFFSCCPIIYNFSLFQPIGVAVHETLHALGLLHQHVRGDRDDHLTINWENINPQVLNVLFHLDNIYLELRLFCDIRNKLIQQLRCRIRLL
jgi:astacin